MLVPLWSQTTETPLLLNYLARSERKYIGRKVSVSFIYTILQCNTSTSHCPSLTRSWKSSDFKKNPQYQNVTEIYAAVLEVTDTINKVWQSYRHIFAMFPYECARKC
jgi:hypothetical protein